MSAFASSPARTAEEPMAFTSDELLRGGITAWVVFMALLVLGEAVHLTALRFWSESSSATPGSFSAVPETFVAIVPALIIYVLCAGIVAATATPFGILIVMVIARAMRRHRAIGVHLAVYAAFSAGIGGACIAVAPSGNPMAWFVIIPAASFAVAIPLAWWWTARRALRIDAGLITPRPRRPDPDAAYEDRIPATGLGGASAES